MCHLAHSFFCFIRYFEWYYYRSLWGKPLFSFKLLRDQHVFLSLVILRVITVRTIGVHRPHHWCWVSARWYDMIKRVIVVYPLWRENKMCRNCENSSRLCTVKSECASEYAISHIHSNIPDFLQWKKSSIWKFLSLVLQENSL